MYDLMILVISLNDQSPGKVVNSTIAEIARSRDSEECE